MQKLISNEIIIINEMEKIPFVFRLSKLRYHFSRKNLESLLQIRLLVFPRNIPKAERQQEIPFLLEIRVKRYNGGR